MITVNDSYSVNSKALLDAKGYVNTKSDLDSFEVSSLHNGQLTYVNDEKAYYSFNEGEWSKLSSGESSNVELATAEKDGLISKEDYTKLQSMSNASNVVILSQQEFNEKKSNSSLEENVVYFIKP